MKVEISIQKGGAWKLLGKCCESWIVTINGEPYRFFNRDDAFDWVHKAQKARY